MAVADPIVIPVGALAAASAVTPGALVWMGVTLGVAPPLLIAGGVGAAFAVLFFDSVPTSGDTLPELARTFILRVMFALLSALIGAYAAPVVGLVVLSMLGILPGIADKLATISTPLQALSALVVAGGAKVILLALIGNVTRRAQGAA